MKVRVSKTRGRRPCFDNPAIEEMIAHEYACSTAKELAAKYGPLARDGKISESTVRAIHKRCAARREQNSPLPAAP